MRLQLECLPCFLRQVLEATKIVNAPQDVKEVAMLKTLDVLKNFKSFSTPPELARDIHHELKGLLKEKDPYKPLKDECISLAKKVLTELKEELEKGDQREKLEFRIRLSGVGNTFDAGAYSIKDMKKLVASIKEELKKEFAVWHFEKFWESLKKAKKVLIIGDNAGETVFDKVLIDELKNYAEVTYAVRPEPIINDATVEDAINSGIHEVARIIPTGCNLPGVVLKECNEEFLKEFESADIVISKGQGNFESLSEEKKTGLFFLLKIKCPVIARHVGIGVGNYVFLSYI
ncbi:MAG: DUF89 family protein [Thermodesulfobacteria bacterium]|nr:DUF89 family protein [Thermodesulfobacteriota bacterium]